MGSNGVKKLMVAYMVVAVALSLYYGGGAAAEPQVPCLFVFGDSLSDSGNNNNLQTYAKANYRPYGIDLPLGPTGRFTNGKNAVDVIAELLGFDNYIPPHPLARGREIIKGVNYASGSAGIRSETGQHVGARIDLTTQVNNYKKTVAQVASILGGQNSTANHLKKCIYSIGMGSNDIADYFLPQFYRTSFQYTPTQFADVLIQQYSEQLRALYSTGARKFVLFGLGQIGCTPSAMALITIFFFFLNSGFKVTNAACCGTGKNKAQITCLPLQIPCQNRHEYVFWDAFHPTEAVNNIIGKRSYTAQKTSDAYPYDIRRLVQL